MIGFIAVWGALVGGIASAAIGGLINWAGGGFDKPKVPKQVEYDEPAEPLPLFPPAVDQGAGMAPTQRFDSGGMRLSSLDLQGARPQIERLKAIERIRRGQQF